ncbi:hypothetical protein [Treponema sp.]|uniref:hypothetical protein n=1 Tax=Treponema sp. TaxID=166 RepID=UPI003F0A6B75
MKKLILFVMLGAAASSLFAARTPRVKDEIETVKMGKFDPVELGSGTFRLKKILKNELEAKDFSVMLYPKNGTAGIVYKNTPNKERLLLDKDARKAVINSYNAYLKDFEEKKLDRKQNKYKAIYEYARAKVEWGPFQFSSYADPKISMGYVFVGKSPYFCIKIPSTKSSQKKGDVQIEYGGNLLYFTRAQAKDLVDALSDDEIQKALSAQIVELPSDDVYDSGDYEEADEGDYEEN